MEKKLKVLTLSDNPLMFSGVGIQTRYMIEGLLKTGKYQFISLGGSENPSDTRPIKTNEYGDDWVIIPTNMQALKAHANAEMVRSILATEKPDVVWFMTDPRFWEWLWMIEHEIRPHVPILYYHVWDNYPAPTFNAKFYNSNDVIVTISKLTDDIVKLTAPEVTRHYLPHTVNTDIFKRYPKEEIEKREQIIFGSEGRKGRFVFFWNSRNQRRKHAGTMIYWFKEFLDTVGRDKAVLIMHTDPFDPHGSNLEALIKELGLTNGEVRFSTNNKTTFDDLAYFYNIADCTLNSSDAEGFGLCLDPNSEIIMDNGKSKLLKNIQVGEDYVLAKDGKEHRVLAKKLRQVDKVLRIKTMTNPELVCSEEHPLFVLKNEQTGEGDWKQAKNLTEYDYVGILLPSSKPKENEDLPDVLDIMKFCEELASGWRVGRDKDNVEKIYISMGYSSKTNGLSIQDIADKYNISKYVAENARRLSLNLPIRSGHSYTQAIRDVAEKIKDNGDIINDNVISINRYIKVDDEFLNFVGWYLAEGDNHGGAAINFSLNGEKELPTINRLSEYMSNAMGVSNIKIRIRDKKGEVMGVSSLLSQLMGKLCGIYSYNKNINPILLKNTKRLAPLIKGLFEGDGHAEDGGRIWSLTTVSGNLAWQVKQTLLSQGIMCSLKKYPPSEVGVHDQYVLRVGGRYAELLTQWTSLKNVYTCSRKRAEHYKIYDNIAYVPILSIECVDELRELMDIQVEGEKSFIANGLLVHNSTLESLACETPIVVGMTGGLKDQVFDGENYYGIGVFPSSSQIIGSQVVPFIYEDRFNTGDYVEAMLTMYRMSEIDREELGKKCRERMLRDFGMDKYISEWDRIMQETHEKFGSWDTRKNYTGQRLVKVL